MELIKIHNNNGNQVVSARELYTFLGYDKSQWSRWYSKNIINNEYAVENEDYQELDFESRSSKTKDFALTIDFAKKLSMLARTDKGEDARNYFIECEKKLKQVTSYSIPQTYPEALKLAYEQSIQIEQQQKQIKKQQHYVNFVEKCFDNDEKIDIGQAAKILELPYGRNTLFKKLREMGVFFNSKNEPKQDFINRGYFLLKQKWIERNEHDSFCITKVLVTQRGLAYLSAKLNGSNGSIPRTTIH